jgi:hypothetical protein
MADGELGRDAGGLLQPPISRKASDDIKIYVRSIQSNGTWNLTHTITSKTRNGKSPKCISSCGYIDKMAALNEMPLFQRAIAKDKAIHWISPGSPLDVLCVWVAQGKDTQAFNEKTLPPTMQSIARVRKNGVISANDGQLYIFYLPLCSDLKAIWTVVLWKAKKLCVFCMGLLTGPNRDMCSNFRCAFCCHSYAATAAASITASSYAATAAASVAVTGEDVASTVGTGSLPAPCRCTHVQSSGEKTDLTYGSNYRAFHGRVEDGVYPSGCSRRHYRPQFVAKVVIQALHV